MSQALSTIADQAQRLALITDAVAWLRDNRGVTVRYVTWPGRELADWHSATRTLEIAADATLIDQIWAFTEVVRLLDVGPDACPAARKTPILHLVPEPGATLSN
jgi:hypothetical protein